MCIPLIGIEMYQLRLITCSPVNILHWINYYFVEVVAQKHVIDQILHSMTEYSDLVGPNCAS